VSLPQLCILYNIHVPKAIKFLQAAKISEIKAKLKEQVSQLVCNREPNRSSSASQNVPPTAKKKA